MNKQEKIDYILKTLDILGFLETNKGLNEKIKNLSEEKYYDIISDITDTISAACDGEISIPPISSTKITRSKDPSILSAINNINKHNYELENALKG